MKRNTILKILNPILGVLVVNQIVTGFSRDAIPDKVYDIVHVGGGVVLTVLVVLHVILNWSWVKVNFFRRAPAVGTPVPHERDGSKKGSNPAV